MFVTVRTQTGSDVLCNSDHVVAVHIPGVIEQDTQCRIYLIGPVMLGVTHDEADRVKQILSQATSFPPVA